MTDQVDLAMRYHTAWAAHDPDAIIAMHTQDTVFHTHGMGEPAVGADATREAIVGLFALAPDLSFETKTVYFGEGSIVTEYVVSGTSNGASFAVDGVDVFKIRDGLVARKDTYMDTAGLQQQLAAGVSLETAEA
jgi:steroid delta-isomerase-like uncharacterized protein